MQRIRLNKEPRLDSKHEAFEFQNEAFLAVRDIEYSAIFHEQGLGKTKIAIDLLLYWLETQEVDTVLLIVKKGLITNWQREIRNHSHLSPRLLSQDKRQNFYTFNSPARVILSHYEVLKSEQARLQLFLKGRDVAVILDESTKIKNPDSALTRSAHALAPLFRKRVILTGTPVANRPYDLWSQIYFLDLGRSLGKNFADFRRNMDLTCDLAEDIDKQKRLEIALSHVFEQISSFSVRRLKRDSGIRLPGKTVRTVLTEWEPRQRDLYRQIEVQMRAVVIKNGIPSEDNAENVLKRMTRLVQTASNPSLITEQYHAYPGKWPYLLDIVNGIMDRSEKCIIWTAFTKNCDWLARELSAYGARSIHGKLAMKSRDAALAAFMEHDDVRVLVATPGAAKEGLTLTVANHMVFFDRTFSLDDYLQAQDRIHRISQEKECYIHNLIMRDSIDEWVDVLLESKHLAAQLAQGDVSLEYYQSQMSYEFSTILRRILGIERETNTTTTRRNEYA